MEVDITCFLVNKSTSWKLVNNTSHEAWTRKKPSCRNLRVLGYDAYIHVPKKNRSKLDSKV